ncbi:MAG TPA: ComF family protein [Candidatus Paceibacterota bacterium]
MNRALEKLIHTTRLISKHVLGLLLPQKCLKCGAPGKAFCSDCQRASYKAGGQCLICGFRNGTGGFCPPCRKSSSASLEKVLWAGRYDGALKGAVWELKYKNRKTLAEPLARMLFQKFSEIFPDFKNGEFLAIPIPLHKSKLRQRGFNQAGLLAKEFSRLSNIRLLTNSLLKIKETPAQVEAKNKEERIKNLEGAFVVNLPLHNPLLIKEGEMGVTTIILIDDIATTGATLIHAANALKLAGAQKIIGLVVAHGG